ncbi:NUDIX hydrolase [Candidatus Uhrbacteria bacterium]|nr:NUDIX hydrolase [Candidatus Uhrbacteria bacterium]
MLYREKPENFSPKFKAAGCFLEWDGNILLLFRAGDRNVDPNTWCVPAGKIEEGETKEDCIIREVKEEIGMSYTPEHFEYLHETYCRYTEFDFVYYVFRVKVQEEPKIALNREHTEYAWMTPEEALTKPLIRDEDAVIRLIYGSHL